MTRKEVQNSLLDQLRLQNKVSDFYVDLVNDYMDYWTLKKKLIADIRKKGLIPRWPIFLKTAICSNSEN